MPFDTLGIDLACFFSLITLLTSLPTEPYQSAWQDNPTSYRIVQRPHDHEPVNRNKHQFDGHIFPPENRNISTGTWEPEKQSNLHNPRWYHSNRRSAQWQEQSQGPSVDGNRRTGMINNRDLDSREGEEFPGSESSGSSGSCNSTYSSHTNCEESKGSDSEPDKMAEMTDESYDDSEESEATPGEDAEKINFDMSRNSRKGNTREGEPTSLRIITPKGRPNSRRPLKGGNNKLATTEKTFRNQTQKDGFHRQKFIPRGGKCGKTTTFCEHVGEEYPSEYINQILKKEGAMFREFFGTDVISDPNITERIHAPEENSLCPFRQEVVFPRAAKNKEDKWLFVINQDQYVQGVTVEVCLNPESRCILTEGFPLGYTPYCKQKYIERRLVAIGEDGKPHSDSFRLPSCCSCVVKHETSSRIRMARDMSPAIRSASSRT